MNKSQAAIRKKIHQEKKLPDNPSEALGLGGKVSEDDFSQENPKKPANSSNSDSEIPLKKLNGKEVPVRDKIDEDGCKTWSF